MTNRNVDDEQTLILTNRDEALRAKCLAERWMLKPDFSMARRFAVKAQKMYQKLEDISKMILVCDVHCAALEKVRDQTDWYKILQVEHNADDNAIKKQYRNFALALHPDKNNFPGAEAAFKMVSEAKKVLLNMEARRLCDSKLKRRVPSYQPTGFSESQTAFQTSSAQPQSKIPTQESAKTAHKQPKSKKKETSSDSFSREGSYEFENVAATGEQHSRKSVRRKQKVSYVEDVCDDDKTSKKKKKKEEEMVKFEVSINPAYLKYLRIPTNFKDAYIKSESDIEFTILHHEKKKGPWEVRCKVKPWQAVLGKGWLKLVKEYPLSVGDICTFYLVNPTTFALASKKPDE